MKSKGFKGLYEELSRRNVVRVAVSYVVMAWFVLQLFDLVLDNIDAPSWVMKTVFLTLIAGFFISLFLSWVYEITPEGIKREEDVVRDDSITNITAHRLNIITIAILIVAIGLMVGTRLLMQDETSESSSQIGTGEASTNQPDSNESAQFAKDSIAVLPFANVANLPENEPFTLGLHDDLLTHISKIDALRVISRTSVVKYKNTTMSIGEIAKELGVAFLLEGGVQRAGDQIRINVTLIDAKTDGPVWAEKYDRALTVANIFEIQSDITERIANALEAQLSPQLAARLNTPPTDSLEAYNMVLAGRQNLLIRTPETIREAEKLFSQAIELDPNYAQAYVGLADTILMLYSFTGMQYEEFRKRGRPLLDKAIELDASSVEAHTSLGAHLRFTGEYHLAEESFKKALELGQNYATTYHWYSSLLRRIGRHEESLEMINKAIELDPLSASLHQKRGKNYVALGRYEDALIQYKRAIQLNPEFAASRASIAVVNLRMGNLDQAIEWQSKANQLNSKDIVEVQALGRMYLDLKLLDEAKTLLNNATAGQPRRDATEHLRNQISYYLGDTQQAYENSLATYKELPGNPNAKRDLAVYSFLIGDYEKVVELWMEAYPGASKKEFKLSATSAVVVPQLAIALRKVGRSEEADQLLLDAVRICLEQTPLERRFLLPQLLAAKGDALAAAEAYAAAVDAGVRADWWQLERLPFLSDMREQPAYIEAHKTLTEDIHQQRERVMAEQ